MNSVLEARGWSSCKRPPERTVHCNRVRYREFPGSPIGPHLSAPGAESCLGQMQLTEEQASISARSSSCPRKP